MLYLCEPSRGTIGIRFLLGDHQDQHREINETDAAGGVQHDYLLGYPDKIVPMCRYSLSRVCKIEDILIENQFCLFRTDL